MKNSYKEYRDALNDIYNTPQGKLVFDVLEKAHVEASCFDSDINSIIYRLGQKELIQNLIEEAKIKYKEEKLEECEYV